ncbi:type 2 isopentenyl-diphosphate Delta-isomerase [candidate division WWE3 bacterium]|uniref:Isopentenyl-diphosphate delta-isomerase n=1 Tax=candidate division WWE3 bacterium TaxID=2053526 RepID=A0A955RWZ3_UNCKA|nr:type 2 isopentenyl-diphosphate Delta-isomerase [candidate division WWE3 bacterium]
MEDIQKRKVQHIQLAQQSGSQMDGSIFERYSLPYKALPEVDLDDVSTATSLLEKQLSQPLIIASMTGGEAYAKTINKHLAIAAQEMNVAIGVGSQRVALEVPSARESFSIVRKHAPDAVVFANLAGVQLNYGYDISHYEAVVDMIEADALYIHLNPLQEAIQPEGDTNFLGLREKLGDLISRLSVPVFVKEVGHGLDIETCKFKLDAGVSGLDIAGTGGTSWSWIESQRRGSDEFSDWFKSVGNSTESILQDLSMIEKNVSVVASGGIRNPVHGLMARSFGADYYSAARPFLHAALDSEKAVIDALVLWQQGLQIALFITGIQDWEQARFLELELST